MNILYNYNNFNYSTINLQYITGTYYSIYLSSNTISTDDYINMTYTIKLNQQGQLPPSATAEIFSIKNTLTEGLLMNYTSQIMHKKMKHIYALTFYTCCQLHL